MAALGSQGTQQRSVLVVDDEPGMRALFSFMLGAKGFNVHTAASGEEAISNVCQRSYDLVFLDIRMPYMDGVQVLKALKKQRPEIHVVMMTGYAVEQLLDDALAEGARSYLRKPFTLDELLRSIDSILGNANP